MKIRCVLFVMFVLAVLRFCGTLAALQEPRPPAGEEIAKTVDDPTRKDDRLRRPGFLFLELDCRDLASHIEFFKTVTGFELNRKDGNFVILRSERGEILLNGIGGKAGEKPARYQGPRVEIGMVVGDLDASFAAAKKHTGWTIASGIQRQSWGVRDFRVFSPEGYYIRITEGPK